jgi:hypothetical protein
MSGVIYDEDNQASKNESSAIAWTFIDHPRMFHFGLASAIIPLCSILRLSLENNFEDEKNEEFEHLRKDKRISDAIELPNDPRFTKLVNSNKSRTLTRVRTSTEIVNKGNMKGAGSSNRSIEASRQRNQSVNKHLR